MAQPKHADLQPVVTPSAPTVKVPVAVQAAKPPHKSATVIVNLLVTLGSLVVLIDPADINGYVSRQIGNQELSTSVAAAVVALLGIVNVLLRIYKTKQPIV